jgi:hypothetical protein
MLAEDISVDISGYSNVWLEALEFKSVSDSGSATLCTKFGYYTMYNSFITSMSQ